MHFRRAVQNCFPVLSALVLAQSWLREYVRRKRERANELTNKEGKKERKGRMSPNAPHRAASESVMEELSQATAVQEWC